MMQVPFERFHRLFYPQVAAVVTASDGVEVGGLLASSVMPVSFNPPRVAAALGKGHNTTRLVEKSGAFAVNWLSYEHAAKMELLANPAPPGVTDKLKACGFSYRIGAKTSAPILTEASAFLECRVLQSLDVGDHFLVVASVDEAMATDDFGDYWRFESYKPVVYVGLARPGWPRFLMFPRE